MTSKLTKKQIDLLLPWGNEYQSWVDRIQSMSVDERRDLYEAACATSQTNCWYASFQAADIIKDVIASHTGWLTYKEIKEADEAEKNSPPSHPTEPDKREG